MPSVEHKAVPKQTVLLAGPSYAVMGTAAAVMKPNKRGDAVERTLCKPPTQITELI